MAQTTVYGCDWCNEIVPTKTDGSPRFAGVITVKPLNAVGGTPAKSYEICADCFKVQKAVSEGKFRR